MNITEETVKRVEGLGFKVYGDVWHSLKLSDGKDFKNANMLTVIKASDGIYRSFKTPANKEVTLTWIMDKLSSESNYQNLSKYLNKLVKSSFCLYAASYGIGLDAFGEVNKEDENKIKELLDGLGLEYKTEYSEASWIYRFVISKNKSNIEILKNI